MSIDPVNYPRWPAADYVTFGFTASSLCLLNPL